MSVDEILQIAPVREKCKKSSKSVKELLLKASYRTYSVKTFGAILALFCAYLFISCYIILQFHPKFFLLLEFSPDLVIFSLGSNLLLCCGLREGCQVGNEPGPAIQQVGGAQGSGHRRTLSVLETVFGLPGSGPGSTDLAESGFNSGPNHRLFSR
jgi:hypothetical protein